MTNEAFLLYDGTNTSSLNPNWDLKYDDRKIENVHRTRTGAMYRYKWGSFKRMKLNVEWVSSADKCQINSWWGANTPLRLYDASSVLVMSCYIVNVALPISGIILPYTDQFKGIIELETY